jgi:DNA invertase Pin-like site-specific DNA recombinase
MYSRFSSKKQKDGSSLERQHSNIPQWLARNPTYRLSELAFEDLGKSGWKGDHIKEGGGFAKLLAAIEAGAIKSQDAVLVEAVDRAGRLDMLGMLEILGKVLRAGVTIVTLSDDVTYTRASLDGGHIYVLIGKIQAAREYSNSISRNLKGSFESRRKLAAQGITPKRTTPAWLTSAGEVIPEVAAQVKLAFELYASGLGKSIIAKRMRDSGVDALAKCSGPGVEGWLRNEAAIGKWNGSQVYPPIIDLSLFHRTQIEGAKRKTAPRVKTATHFFVGLVKCGCCGGNYIMRSLKGVQVSMRCRNRQDLMGCSNRRLIPVEVIDAIYRQTSARAALKALAREDSGVNEKAILAAEARLLEISAQMHSLVEAIRSVGVIPEVLAELQAVKLEREDAERTLTLLKATVVPPSADGWRKQGEVWSLERSDSQRLSAMLREIGYSITVHPDKTLTASGSGTVYRFASVDRRSGSYRLYAGEQLILLPKNGARNHEYHEPFDNDEVASYEWNDEDYENLRRQYEN